MLVVALLLLAAFVAYVALARAPFFKLEHLSVEGNQHLSVQEVQAAIGLQLGDSRWKSDASELVRRLRREPWVKDAQVSWRLGGELQVRILERQPLALVHYHNLYVSLDDTGTVLDLVPALTGNRLPVISGVTVPPLLRGDTIDDSGLRAALDALSLLQEGLRGGVAELTTSADTFMTMYLTGDLEGCQVKLGRSDRLDEKITVLTSFWQRAVQGHLRPKAIIVENPGMPSWEL